MSHISVERKKQSSYVSVQMRFEPNWNVWVVYTIFFKKTYILRKNGTWTAENTMISCWY